MNRFILLSTLLSFKLSASDINVEHQILTHENASLIGFSVVNSTKELSGVCSTITINKYYKDVNQDGLFIELQNLAGQTIFSSKISASEHENNDLVNFKFCYKNHDIAISSVLVYGNQSNTISSTYLDISSELIMP